MRAIHMLIGCKELEVKEVKSVRGDTTWDVFFTTDGRVDDVKNTDDINRYKAFLENEYCFYE